MARRPENCRSFFLLLLFFAASLYKIVIILYLHFYILFLFLYLYLAASSHAFFFLFSFLPLSHNLSYRLSPLEALSRALPLS